MSARHLLFHLGLTLFLNLFFFVVLRGVGSAVLLIGLQLFLVSYFWHHVTHLRRAILITSLAVLYFAAVLITRSSSVTQTLLLLGGGTTVLATFYLLSLKQGSFQSLSELVLFLPRTFSTYLKSAPKSFLHLATNSAKPESKARSSTATSILIGIALSIPIVLILTVLLSGADPIFGKIITQMTSGNSVQRLIQHGILSVVILAALIPTTGMQYPHFRDPGSLLRKQQLATEFSVVALLIAAVLGLFVVVQWQYIFIPSVAGVDLSQFGFSTYSEYVQRGFTEFIFVSGFLFLLLWIGLLIWQGTGSKLLLSLQLLVGAEFLVLLGSFFRRIWLYQHYHGMTLIRFYGGFLMVTLLIFLCTLLARHFWKFSWVKAESVLLLLALAVVSTFNVEGYIVQHPPTVNERVDYTYLSRLSADGVAGWIVALDAIQDTQDRLEEKTTLYTDEDRKELAYAGLALQQITYNYLNLTAATGSEEAQEQTQSELREFAQQQYAAYLLQLQTVLEQENTHQSAVAMLATQSATPQLSNTIVALSGNIERVSYLRNRLEPDAGELLTIKFPQHSVLSYRPFWQYYDSDVACAYAVGCYSKSFLYLHPESPIPQSFLVAAEEDSHSLSWRARILQQTLSDRSAYASLTGRISLSELLTLQKQHFKLYERVTSGSQSDARFFTTDISISAPLLPEIK